MTSLEKIGRYDLIRRLATGGMAEIFLGKLVGAAGFEKEVVIKRILPQWSSDADFIAMMIDEAKIAVQLNHPNIVQVFELGREAEVYYIAMEFVNGVDLRRLLQKMSTRREKFPIGVALWIICEALEGLAYAHERTDTQGHPLKIVHRDISPQNLLVSFDGRVKIADFGIAKAASRSQETVAGVLKGKFAYMSPEQANQEGLDCRSDLFSLAVVFYELLTGERMFTRGSDLDTLDRVRRGLAEFSPEAELKIPETLKVLLRKALERSKMLRFSSASAFRKALCDFADRTGLRPSREAAAAFFQSFFPEEVHRQEKRIEQETRILASETPAFQENTQENTKTAANRQVLDQQILAQSETVFRLAAVRPAPATPKGGYFVEPDAGLKSGERIRGYRVSPRAALIGLGAVGLVTLVVWGVTGPHAQKVPKKIPEKISQARPTPPEVPTPETQKTSAAPETGPLPAARLSLTLVEEARPNPPEAALPKAEIELPAVAKLSERGKGFLSVQAIPWGKVTIDGRGNRETPVHRLALQEGPHFVKVTYEPDGASLSQKIELTAGREIVCIAKFRGGKSLRCGD